MMQPVVGIKIAVPNNHFIVFTEKSIAQYHEYAIYAIKVIQLEEIIINVITEHKFKLVATIEGKVYLLKFNNKTLEYIEKIHDFETKLDSFRKVKDTKGSRYLILMQRKTEFILLNFVLNRQFKLNRISYCLSFEVQVGIFPDPIFKFSKENGVVAQNPSKYNYNSNSKTEILVTIRFDNCWQSNYEFSNYKK